MNMDGLCNLTEWTNRWWPVLELAEVKLSIYLKSVVKDCKKTFLGDLFWHPLPWCPEAVGLTAVPPPRHYATVMKSWHLYIDACLMYSKLVETQNTQTLGICMPREMEWLSLCLSLCVERVLSAFRFRDVTIKYIVSPWIFSWCLWLG